MAQKIANMVVVGLKDSQHYGSAMREVRHINKFLLAIDSYSTAQIEYMRSYLVFVRVYKL